MILLGAIAQNIYSDCNRFYFSNKSRDERENENVESLSIINFKKKKKMPKHVVIEMKRKINKQTTMKKSVAHESIAFTSECKYMNYAVHSNEID